MKKLILAAVAAFTLASASPALAAQVAEVPATAASADIPVGPDCTLGGTLFLTAFDVAGNESPPSESVRIPNDSGTICHITWTANSESDLAGYRLFTVPDTEAPAAPAGIRVTIQ